MSYKTDCPACGGNNFFVSTKYSYCFTPGCGYREDEDNHYPESYTRSRYIEEIRAFYTKTAHYYHSALDAKALQFLYARGFNDATIQSLKIGYCPSGISPLYHGQIPLEAGIATTKQSAFFGDRITFPYFHTNGTVTDIRARTMDSTQTYKYLSPRNGSYYRGADYPYNYHLHTQDTILLTEGEIKADLAVQCGYATLALPGMGVWRKGFKQHEGQKVIIMFDSQYKGMNDVRKAIINAANYLSDPYVATLPLFGENKVDIDSFILRYGTEGLHTVVRGALPFNTWKILQR